MIILSPVSNGKRWRGQEICPKAGGGVSTCAKKSPVRHERKKEAPTGVQYMRLVMDGQGQKRRRIGRRYVCRRNHGEARVLTMAGGGGDEERRGSSPRVEGEGRDCDLTGASPCPESVLARLGRWLAGGRVEGRERGGSRTCRVTIDYLMKAACTRGQLHTRLADWRAKVRADSQPRASRPPVMNE